MSSAGQLTKFVEQASQHVDNQQTGQAIKLLEDVIKSPIAFNDLTED